MKRNSVTTPEQRRASNPRRSVWVSANAGSGKTHVLVERVIRLLLDGAHPSTILCVTYTKAAASEMSERLFGRLSRWSIISDEELDAELRNVGAENNHGTRQNARKLFTATLETPGGLKVQTLHGFAERLLQLFPVEAGMVPGFSVMDENAEQEMERAAAQLILDQDESSPLRHDLSQIAYALSAPEFAALLAEFAATLRSSGLKFSSREVYEGTLKSALEIPITSRLSEINRLLAEVDGDAYSRQAGILKQCAGSSAKDRIDLLVNIAHGDATLEKRVRYFITGEKTLRKSLLPKAVAEKCPDVVEFLDQEAQRFFSLLTQRDMLARISASGAVLNLSQVFEKHVEREKRRTGRYNFDDLIERAQRLLASSHSASWVLFKLDPGLTHILLDEAQDTSPAQWKIIGALAQEFFSGRGNAGATARTLFVVGDRKQSIFSFQGADLDTFGSSRIEFLTLKDALEQPVEGVELAISYRSSQIILDVVDQVFKPQALSHIGIKAHDQSERPHTAIDPLIPGHFAMWNLIDAVTPAETPHSWQARLEREDEESARRRLARQIAETLGSWIGHRVLAAERRPVQASDILILVQSRGQLYRLILSELNRRGLAVAGADRLALQSSLPVQDCLALAQWCLLPMDDHSLACVLKSPLMPHVVSEDELFLLAHGRDDTSLWSRVLERQNPNIGFLTACKERAAVLSPHAFFAWAVNEALIRYSKRMGIEATEALDAIVDEAQSYTVEHGGGLSGFLYWFSAQDVELKRELDQGAGAIRVMTVHGAKGLEGNIVILPDTADRPVQAHRFSPFLSAPRESAFVGLPLWRMSGLLASETYRSWQDAEKRLQLEERNRLLYVAMTRAKFELYMAGIQITKTLPTDCWWQTVSAAVGTEVLEDFFSSPEGEAEFELGEQKPDTELPLWLSSKAPETVLPPQAIAAAMPKAANDLSRGQRYHNILEALGRISAARRVAMTSTLASRFQVSEDEIQHLSAVLNIPELAIFNQTSTRSEVDIRGVLPRGLTVSGRVDRLLITATDIWLLDYKTDRVVPENRSADHPYLRQMAVYAAVLRQAYPTKILHAALVWTETKTVEWLSPEVLSRPLDDLQDSYVASAS